jgi:hypothetical protein
VIQFAQAANGGRPIKGWENKANLN